MDKEMRRELYEKLHGILSEFAGEFDVRSDPGKFALWTSKPMIVDNVTKDGYYFAGLRELKNIVGFYFMPIYVCPELRHQVPDSLTKILKGHTCFNVKILSPEMEEDFRSLMRIGINAYRAKSWL